MQSFYKRNASTLGQGGLILGYELSDRAFKPVLDMAGKGAYGWKYPTFISQLAQDPTPLLLEERWYYDPNAVYPALDHLANSGTPGIEKLRTVFQSSNRFEAVSIESHLLKSSSVSEILETMENFEKSAFTSAINPLERTYGTYAHPNNYEFERMNAGIIKALSLHYPQVSLLDDTLRSPVYEFLKVSSPRTSSPDAVIGTVKASFRNPLLPLPALHEWTPEEFVRIQCSKGADQLREILQRLKTCNPEDTRRWLDQAMAKAKSLDPKENIVYALSGFGGSILSAVQAQADLNFVIPSFVFGIVGAYQLLKAIEDFGNEKQFSWLKVAEKIASWAPSREV